MENKFQSVDWHGQFLHIDQDEKGFITISRYPFETVFNSEEVNEIHQFLNEYHKKESK
jgi:hypothetical protein